jgi:hypothetical protein
MLPRGGPAISITTAACGDGVTNKLEHGNEMTRRSLSVSLHRPDAQHFSSGSKLPLEKLFDAREISMSTGTWVCGGRYSQTRTNLRR